MQIYQKEFIEFILKNGALRFGAFKLKSGRISPYFFNAGVFQDGLSLAKLGDYYAAAITNSKIDYDMLFGPAYKGIPLACACAIALANHHKRNVPYCFNRKEIKDHGEGGNIIGAPLKGKVLIVDDVITAGTAIRESMQLIHAAHAKLAGVIIALDRQEKGQQNISAIQEIEQNFHARVISIIKFEHILEYLTQQKEMHSVAKELADYRLQYGSETA